MKNRTQNSSYDKRGGRSDWTGGRSDKRNGDQRKDTAKESEKILEAKKIPEDYVDKAEEAIDKHKLYKKITTSKLRNILTLITDIYNVEVDRTEEMLTEESAAKLQMARIRIAYECGREPLVQEFVEKSHLLNYVKQVCKTQLRREFIDLARYMEALVAYHRFFGGKD